MYEPIIDPMIFYWIDLVGKLPGITCMCGLVTAVFATFTIVSFKEWRDAEEQDKDHKALKRLTKISTIIFCIVALLNFLLPSESALCKMMIAKQVTPHNLQVTGETIDKLAEKIINVTQEVKK